MMGKITEDKNYTRLTCFSFLPYLHILPIRDSRRVTIEWE